MTAKAAQTEAPRPKTDENRELTPSELTAVNGGCFSIGWIGSSNQTTTTPIVFFGGTTSNGGGIIK